MCLQWDTEGFVFLIYVILLYEESTGLLLGREYFWYSEAMEGSYFLSGNWLSLAYTYLFSLVLARVLASPLWV